jgi:hypothetical protein
MRHVFQTDGEPPSIGRTRRAKYGSVQKRRNALVRTARANVMVLGGVIAGGKVASAKSDNG